MKTNTKHEYKQKVESKLPNRSNSTAQRRRESAGGERERMSGCECEMGDERGVGRDMQMQLIWEPTGMAPNGILFIQKIILSEF